MHRASPKIREFATRLIATETGKPSSEPDPPAASRVCEKLSVPLATLTGRAGFRALLSRALALASTEVAWLQGVEVKADFTLDGLEKRAQQVDPAKIVEGQVALVAQLLALLVKFIGEKLTVGLVREAWPELSFDDLDVGN